ncbi:hypothetical protein QYF61_022067 [Mycteria americana]|uniref:Polyprotein n=1 Tax=Mycteria americana TaxID=33587 RepID=A0AAN7NKZ6_MYCAM|nr:hypothetical protein QYF61_022067 [Mycteria americana]
MPIRNKFIHESIGKGRDGTRWFYPELSRKFSVVAIDERPKIKLTWKKETPAWVAVLQELVAEQLQQGHITPTTSPWNSPVFIIKKKSGKWRLLHDLRQINKVIEEMGSLQPRLPSLTMIP